MAMGTRRAGWSAILIAALLYGCNPSQLLDDAADQVADGNTDAAQTQPDTQQETPQVSRVSRTTAPSTINEPPFNSGPMGPFGLGSAQTFIIENPPLAESDVTLTITAIADISDSNEWVTVTVNDTWVAEVFRGNPLDCEPVEAIVTVDQNLFNDMIAADGHIRIGFSPTTEVWAGFCTASSIEVEVWYCGGPDCNLNGHADNCDILNGISADVNGNRVPDECDYAELPRVVGAASTGNTGVTIVFSNPMGDSAEVASNYVIVQENVNAEVGALGIVSAAFLDGDRNAVALTTLPQNEVEYRITAVGVKDMSGNALAPKQFLAGTYIDPTSSTFAGTPFGCPSLPCDLPDQDGDGVPDAEEQRGYVVSVLLADGQTVVTREVTSDPTSPDTDGDGLTDLEEKQRTIDPRRPDTDDDGVSDLDEVKLFFSSALNQDTDRDRLTDALEIYTIKSSPTLADSDGDGLEDGQEVNEMNRNPRLSDLPRPKIVVGNINLTVKEEYILSETTGESTFNEEGTSVTLEQGESSTTSETDSETTSTTIEENISVDATISAKPSLGGGYSLTNSTTDEYTTSVTEESTQSANEAYQDSLTEGQEIYTESTVTREVREAAVTVDVTIQAVTDVAFTLSNLELALLAQKPGDRSQFVAVAAMVPEGNPDRQFNLGPFVPEIGPIVFKNSEVFPNVVDNLLRAPRGTQLKVANYDVTDEFGRNFAFASQEVFDRTAGIVIDYGDGRVERYRVATSVALIDPATKEVVGGLDANRQPRGIPMWYALQNVIGLGKTNAGDTTGYQTTEIEGTERLIRVGDLRTQDPNEPDFRNRLWYVLTSADIDVSTDFDKLILKPGDSYSIAYLTDEDFDGLTLREENIHGCSDVDTNSDGQWQIEAVIEPATRANGTADVLAREDDVQATPFGATGVQPGQVILLPGPNGVIDSPLQAILEPASGGDGLANTTAVGDDIQSTAVGAAAQPRDIIILPGPNGVIDSVPAGDDIRVGGDDELQTIQADTIGDYDEVRTGWSVNVVGDLPYTAFPDPRRIDTDGDNLPDDVERRLGTDPRKADTDNDRIPDDIELTGYTIRLVENHPDGDKINVTTDPLNDDSDGDNIIDGDEQTIGLNPNLPDAGILRDFDEDGVNDFFETFGFETMINGSPVQVTSDPFDPDTDGDRLPDLLEHMIRSNPNSIDTDGDGLSDFDEFNLAATCMGTDPAEDGSCADAVGSIYTTDFLAKCGSGEAPGCEWDEASFLQDSDNWGTNLNRADTDGDTLSDKLELVDKWTVSVSRWNGSTVVDENFSAQPNVFDANSDGDLWDDAAEHSNGTNPIAADTDGDGTRDDVEPTVDPAFLWIGGIGQNYRRNPLVADQIITMTFDRLSIVEDCDGGTQGAGEFFIQLRWHPDNNPNNYDETTDVIGITPSTLCPNGGAGCGNCTDFCATSDYDLAVIDENQTRSFCGRSATVTMYQVLNRPFRIRVQVLQYDYSDIIGCSIDDVNTWDETRSYAGPRNTGELQFKSNTNDCLDDATVYVTFTKR
jgi:hypothetical protein